MLGDFEREAVGARSLVLPEADAKLVELPPRESDEPVLITGADLVVSTLGAAFQPPDPLLFDRFIDEMFPQPPDNGCWSRS